MIRSLIAFFARLVRRPDRLVEPAALRRRERALREPDSFGALTDFDPNEVILNGERAQALLSDPVLSAAFDFAQNRYRQAWESAAPADIESQRLAHTNLAALKQVRGHLLGFINAAKLRSLSLPDRVPNKSDRRLR